MQGRTEAEIDSEVFRHDARNLQLKRRLAERGIDFRGERQITCNFRAPNQRQASQLEQRLIERGFLVLEVSPAGSGEHPIWHVRARIERTIGQAASHEFTEMVVRCAAALSCVYDGWCALYLTSVHKFSAFDRKPDGALAFTRLAAVATVVAAG